MRVVVGDIWDFHKEGNYIVVPTNWTYNRNGLAVMGRGVAKQAADRFPGLAGALGAKIKRNPDTTQVCYYGTLVLLPVKNHWRDRASIDIITGSIRQLKVEWPGVSELYLPLLGAGFGGLDPLIAMSVMALLLPEDVYTVVLKSPDVVHKYRASFAPSMLAQRRDRTI